MRAARIVLGGAVMASVLLVASGCTDPQEADVRLPDSNFLRPVPSETTDVGVALEQSRPSPRLAEAAVPSAMSISVLRRMPGNASVFSAHHNVGDVTTSDLYLRIFGDDGYSIYWLTSGFDQWDVREASAARVVVALQGERPSDDSRKARTVIVTFGSEGGHSSHGFYPTPETVTVAIGR